MSLEQKPFFSIIIPTRNRADLLKMCIQSVLNQDYSDFECIVIDDGSTDQTSQLIKSFDDNRIRYVYQDHQERSNARNRGIELANGKFICFSDDDDFLKPNHFSVFKRFIDSEKYKGEILRVGFVSEPPKRKKSNMYHPGGKKSAVNFAAFNMVGVWSLCIPKAYLETLRFPTEFPHWQDTYFILRLLSRYPFRQLNNKTYVYRIHSGMGSLNIVNEAQLENRASINVAAIKDFESKYFDEVKDHLSRSDFQFLYAEKYIQYTLLAKNSNFKKLAKNLYRRSLSHRWSLRLIKYYIRYCLDIRS